MDVRSCKRCKKLYNVNYITKSVYCPSCMEAMEEKMKEVKNYIWDNRNCSIEQVCEACDVERNLILQWVREERLQLAEGSAICISCELCGVSIPCGRFCENCKKDMVRNLSGSIRKEPDKGKPVTIDSHSNKMRYL